jgi:UDP-N-acetylmuramate dehydrogenase
MSRMRVSLRRYNTFGVRATARRLLAIESVDDLAGVSFDPATDLVLGGGSNVLLAGDVPGTVFLNRIGGMRITGTAGDETLVEAGGGCQWHSLVLWTLAQDLGGLENLSLIPGRVGAAPMQNIGAYGVELSDLLESVAAWDWQAGRPVRFSNRDCRFAYRDSRFRSEQPDRYLVTSISLRLRRCHAPNLTYAGLREELDAMGVAAPTPELVSRAVITIRRRKLPDPARIGNAGSFFKNPVLHPDRAESLRTRFDDLPVHIVTADSAKLSAAWMIEHCGWKGHREGDAGVSDLHALVLVNHGRATGREILALSKKIAASVLHEFGVVLEPEPRIVGASDR